MTDIRPRIEFERMPAAPRSEFAQEHLVRMRDGVRLATDVYLPDGDTTQGATVLVRLPYDKSGDYTFMPEIARYMTARGYRVVVQDVRGKFRSEGEALLFVNEAHDGYDTIEWIIQQSWSNGIVGMWGDSYYGFTQWAAVSTGHPALRAIVPRVTGTDLAQMPLPVPGVPTVDVQMGIMRVYPLIHFLGNDDVNWDMDWSRRPYSQTVEEFFAAVGQRSPSYDLMFPNPVILRRFPAGHPFDAPPVPVLMTIGWWDNCAPWQWADHEEIARRPGWANSEYLLIEAIDHENYRHADAPVAPEHDHAVDAEARARMMPRYLDPALEFFDIFLLGRGRPQDIPRVRWELAGGGADRWRTAESWPPPETRRTTLYPSAGMLSAQEQPESQWVSWVHDPDDPVPSAIPNAFAFLHSYPDERATADRADVLTFTAPAADAPLDLVGPVAFQATIASDGPEMDLFLRLLDVAPDGSAHLIARGQTTLLTATTPTQVTVNLGHTGYRLRAGHRLRLTVASSDAPEYVVAPGTGADRWSAVETVRNRQRLLLGGLDGAHLTLSVSTDS